MTPGGQPPARLVVLAGPTGGGKSALAVALARRFDGVVINADSMQVYRELAVLTARPRLPEIAEVPHRLYGVLAVADPCSVARWSALARTEIAGAAGRLPILVGGTGLYLKALIEGLSPIPDVDPAVRNEVRERLARLGPEALWRELRRLDPAVAARLRASDSQRIQRALEVALGTGQPLSAWQAMPREGAHVGPILALLVAPERPVLYALCDRRFGRMLRRGAADEAAAVLGLGLDPRLPAMKTLGLRELIGYVRGEITLATATAQARQATRNYAKRQTTWFRHQMDFDSRPASIAAGLNRVAAWLRPGGPGIAKARG